MPSLTNRLALAAIACAACSLAVAADAPSPIPARPVHLEEARALAVQNNPSLRAAEAAWRASEGAARQGSALLNPTLEYGREDFGASPPREEVAPQESLTLSQTFRTAGERAARRDTTRFARDAARQDFERVKLDVLAEVDRRFARLLGAQERASIAAENGQTAADVAAAVAALVEAGEVSPVELSRAENDRDLAAIDLEGARRDQRVALVELAEALGQDAPDFDRADGSLRAEGALPPEAHPPDAIGALPDLTRWDAETQSLEASLRLARRTPWPDLTLTTGIRRYAKTGEKAYVAALTIPLPLLDRNRGAVIEASARLDQGRLERRAEEVRLRNASAAARLALGSAVAEVASIEERVLPNARKIFDALDEGYRRGQFRLLDLLEARRSFAAARLRLVDAQVRLRLAQADLERLTAPASHQGATP